MESLDAKSFSKEKNHSSILHQSYFLFVIGSIEHRAQVILYSLMMSEKYEKEINAGLLYYMKASHLQGVPATLKEKRALVIKRNEIVRFLSLENLQNKKLMPGKLNH